MVDSNKKNTVRPNSRLGLYGNRLTRLFLAPPCEVHIVKASFQINLNYSTMLRFFQINVPPFSGLSSPSRERVFWTYAHDRLSASPPHGPEPIRTFNWMGLLNEAEDLA